MSIRVNWDDPEQTIIHLEFGRGWRWEDLYSAVQQADDLITTVPHTVHLIIDIRKAGGLPSDFMRVAGDLFSRGDARPNEGQRVVVGANFVLRAAYQGFTAAFGARLSNRPFAFADSLEQARQLVRR